MQSVCTALASALDPLVFVQLDKPKKRKERWTNLRIFLRRMMSLQYYLTLPLVKARKPKKYSLLVLRQATAASIFFCFIIVPLLRY